MKTEIGVSLGKLHKDLGWKRLDPTWAKAEIFLGLGAASAALPATLYALTSQPWIVWRFVFLAMALFVFGLYLAMAGHRSHLYQSANVLAAYLLGELHDARSRTNDEC